MIYTNPFAFNNTAEGGTHNTNVTAANSGGASGDAWDLVQTVTGRVQFWSTDPIHGAMSYRWPAGTGREVRWYGQNTRIPYARAWFEFSAWPAANMQLFQARTSGDGGISTVGLSTTGRIIGWNRLGTVVTGTNIAGHAIDQNVPFCIEAFFVVDDTTDGAGRMVYAVYEGMNPTPAFMFDSEAAGVAMNTTACDRWYIGQGGGVDNNGAVKMDTIGADPGRSTLVGPTFGFPAVPASPWGLLDGLGGATDLEVVLL